MTIQTKNPVGFMGPPSTTCRRPGQPRVKLFCILFTALLIIHGGRCWASGFSILELGAKAEGMGTAFTAIASDGTAIYYNPAGIAFLPGRQFEMDNIGVFGKFHFLPSRTPPGTIVPQGGYDGQIHLPVQPVGTMYFTMQMRPKWTLGFGSFVPFGLGGNYTNFSDSDPPETKFVARYAGTRDRLESFWFQPTIAYRLTPNSSLAVGVALVHTHLFIEESFLNPRGDAIDFGRAAANQIFPGVNTEQAARAIAGLLPEGRFRVAGTSNSPGFNVGYLYKHQRSKTNIGLMFRSAVTNHISGKANFSFAGDYTLSPFIGPDFLPKAFPNQSVSGSFTTPGTYAIGIANSKFWNTTFAFDFRIQDYSRFQSVPLNFSITSATNKDAVTPAERRLVFDFRNSYNYAFGVEKVLRPSLTVRAGYLYDRSPVVDKSVGPLFPDSDRQKFTVGVTKRRGKMEMTVSYDATRFRDRKTNVAANDNQFTNGEYRNSAQILGLSIRLISKQQ